MAKKFVDLQARMSPEARQRSEALARSMLEAMALQELRQARALSQVDLAERLNVKQAAVSKLERRDDMYVSTLREYIRALGGDLEIIARFPDGDVRIMNFADEPT